jgi:hypothetical protein
MVFPFSFPKSLMRFPRRIRPALEPETRTEEEELTAIATMDAGGFPDANDENSREERRSLRSRV